MRRVALATLRHDVTRSALLVLGLATAWALVAVQLGLRRGFELSSRAILDHAGGEMWISARGVRVVDDGEPLLESVAADIGGACVVRRRSLIVDYTQARRPDGSLVTTQIIGVDEASRGRVPWAVLRGEAASLAAKDAVGIDIADAEKLGLPTDPMGAELELRSGAKLDVTLVSEGARSFTQTPYLFMDVASARRVAALPEGAVTYVLVDLRDQGCATTVKDDASQAGLQAVDREALADTTRAHWISGSGIGTLLGIGSLMAAVVGAAALLLSTATLVRTHTREIATVRALGATRRELASFVAWQVGVVSLLAAILALALATGLSATLRSTGLTVVIGPESWLSGLLLAVVSTLVAAVVGARVFSRMDPRQVLE